MSLFTLVYILLHGIAIGYLGLLAFCMLFLRRSVFVDGEPQCQHLRQATGVYILVWMLSFVFGVAVMGYDGSLLAKLSQLEMATDLLVVPSTMYLLLTMISLNHVYRRRHAILIALPLCLMLVFLFTEDDLLFSILLGYWIAYGIFSLLELVQAYRRYRRMMLDNYSEVEHREVRWIFYFIVFFIVYALLYFWGRQPDAYWVRPWQYLVCLAGLTLLVRRVDTQKRVLDFSQNKNTFDDGLEAFVPETVGNEAPADLVETQPDGGEAAAGRASVPAYHASVEWVGEQLKHKCEENELYLEPDLTLDTVARTVGTNRTYVSRYLSSQGQNFCGYINMLRVNHAVKCFENDPTQPVKEVAVMSGFNSLSTFRRVFAEIKGMSPSRYLEQMEQKT